MSIFSKKTIDAFRNTLKGHGQVVSSQMSIAESATSEEVAKRAEATASAAFNKAVKLKAYAGQHGAALAMWNDVMPMMSRHDPRKARDVQATLETGKLQGEEVKETLTMLATAKDGFISRDANGYCHNGSIGRVVRNNHATFITLLEKGGFIRKERDGRSIVGYTIVPSEFWTAIQDIAS